MSFKNAHEAEYALVDEKAFVVHIDELDMPERPNAKPVAKDREVFVIHSPGDIDDWTHGFGEVEEICRIPSMVVDPDDADQEE